LPINGKLSTAHVVLASTVPVNKYACIALTAHLEGVVMDPWPTPSISTSPELENREAVFCAPRSEEVGSIDVDTKSIGGAAVAFIGEPVKKIS
jgi:hypothetical protein